MLIFSQSVSAEFVLNWSQDTQFPTFNAASIIHGGSLIPNQTPFLYERVQGDEGQAYYHIVVGNPDSGFAQEFYIQTVPSNVGNFFGLIGPELSASPGATGGGSNPAASNAADPLSNNPVIGGNGAGHPERVQIRQIVNDGEMSLEFVKQGLSAKPIISTSIETERHSAVFIMNASDLDYNDMSTPASVTNTLQILDADIPEASATFDMSRDSRDSSITAGRYTYTPGAAIGGSGGTYEYSDGGTNINPDWSSFFDSREPNPWAYPANRPVAP